MIRLLVKILYFALLFFILLSGIAVFLLTTTPGLQTLIDLSHFYVPGTIKIKKLKGSLLNNFVAEGLEYQNKALNLKIKITQLNAQWYPHSLKNHFLTIHWQNVQGQLSQAQKLESSAGTITATTTLPHLSIDLNTAITPLPQEQWNLKTSLNGALPWQWTLDANLSQPQSTLKQPGLHTNLSLKTIMKAYNRGNLALTIHPGYYQAPDNPSIPELQFKGGTINAVLLPNKLIGKGILSIDPNKNLNLTFQLPQFTLNKGIKTQQKINGELKLEINSLDFLENLSPEINKLKGKVTASLKATGTVGKPQIESQVILSQTSLFLPKLGLNLNPIDLTVQSKKNGWQATGSIASEGHNLSLKGSGNLSTEFIADLTLDGSDFQLIKTNEYEINISPQLKLHITPTQRAITGSILIPYAQIKPQSFSNSISLPDEVVYKKQQGQTPPSVIGSSVDINIVMGENVELSIKGLKGFLDGILHIKQQPQGAMNAFGELSVIDGTYKAYGQDLAIQQGELIFTGGPITNPGISLRAAKKVSNTATYSNASQLFDLNSDTQQSIGTGDTLTLGVEVTGRLTSPKVQLFSDPAILSQADILSMLVLGRPASQANKAGGQLLLTAISSMNFGGTNSTQLLEQLKQSSGLDFNVQTNTNYNQSTNTVNDSTAFVVGKSLSKRLYLSYNIGLSQTDSNVLALKYILNKFFSIQISNSDSSSAIDVLYTSNKKITRKK